jgi:cell division protein FtsQ
MNLRPKKNRRRPDAAQRAESLKVALKRQAVVALKLGGALALSGALAFGALEAWSWARRSPRFALAALTYTGCDRAKPEELSRLAGLQSGLNLLALDVPAPARALATHPWVRSVSVTRHLPQGLTVKIDEHVPLAMVSLGDLYLVSAEGIPFKRVQASDGLDLPLLTGLTREDFVNDPHASADRLKAALDVALSWLDSPAAQKATLSEVRLSNEEHALVLSTGEEVLLGEGELPAKLARLKKVREGLAARHLTAAVIRLDNRARPDWVSVQLASNGLERGRRSP